MLYRENLLEKEVLHVIIELKLIQEKMKGGIINEDLTLMENVVVDVQKLVVMWENIEGIEENTRDEIRLENDTIRNLSREDSGFSIHEEYEYEKKVAW